MKHIKIFITSLFFLFCVINTYSQTDTVNYLDLSLEELMGLKVKIASKKTQTLNEAPSIISVYNRESIEKMSVTSLIDVLNFIPGIETSIDINGIYRVSIRGMRKEGTVLLLINGISVNDFYDGGAIFDMPSENIEKIEIIRGPGSAIFGTNAVVGVIDITTTEKNSVKVHLGSNVDYGVNFNAGKKIKSTLLHFTGSYLSSQGANTEPFSEPLTQQNTSETDRYLNEAFLAGKIVNENLNINILANFKEHGSWVGPIYMLTEGSSLKNNKLCGSISYKFELNEKISLQPKLSSTTFMHDFLFKEYPTGSTKFPEGAQKNEKYTGSVNSAELQADIAVSEKFNIITGIVNENINLSNYSIEHDYYPVTSEYTGVFSPLIAPGLEVSINQEGKKRTILASYLQTTYTFNEKISVTAGGRYDNYSDFGNSINPRLGLVYNATKNLNFKLLYGEAFRAPTFKELYDKSTAYDEDGFYGNEELLPERVRSLEFGSGISFKQMLIRANAFYNMGQNSINIYDPDGSGKAGEYENIGDINSYGFETEATFLIGKSLNFFTNFSYFQKIFEYNENGNIRQTDLDYLKNKGDKIMYNIPALRINGGFTYNMKKISCFVGINYGGISYSNNRFNIEGLRNVKIDPYLLASFNIMYSLSEKFKFGISGNNLGKIKYSDPDESSSIYKLGNAGMAQPVNTFLVRASYDFGTNEK